MIRANDIDQSIRFYVNLLDVEPPGMTKTTTKKGETTKLKSTRFSIDCKNVAH